MQDCLKNALNEDDKGSKAEFFQVFTTFFKKFLCNGEFIEETYLKNMHQLKINFLNHAIFKSLNQ